MTTSPDVSVIVPAYNYAHFLPDCLASVRDQRNIRIETIVVDDGSTDTTREVVAQHAPDAIYIYQQNAGLSAARNTGVQRATGRYLQFLDADDLLGPDSLSVRARTLDAKGGSGIAVSNTRIFSEQPRGGKPRCNGAWYLFERNLDVHLCRLNIAPPHAFLISRDVIERTGEFEESMRGCEDYDFWLRACGHGFVPQFSPGACVYYRKHNESMGARKAHRRSYEFDVLVHERKHAGAYGQLTRAMTTLSGRLAFADGVIHTASRIAPAVNMQGRERLIELASGALADLAEIIPSDYGHLDHVAKLYLARLGLRREEVVGLGDSQLCQNFRELMAVFTLPRRFLGNLRSAIPFLRHDHRALASASLKMLLGHLDS